jgi:hypothetical protein
MHADIHLIIFGLKGCFGVIMSLWQFRFRESLCVISCQFELMTWSLYSCRSSPVIILIKLFVRKCTFPLTTRTVQHEFDWLSFCCPNALVVQACPW